MDEFQVSGNRLTGRGLTTEATNCAFGGVSITTEKELAEARLLMLKKKNKRPPFVPYDLSRARASQTPSYLNEEKVNEVNKELDEKYSTGCRVRSKEISEKLDEVLVLLKRINKKVR